MLRRAAIQSGIMTVVGGFFLSRGFTIPGSVVLALAALLAGAAAFAPAVFQTIDGLVARLGALVATAIGGVLLSLVYFTLFAAGAAYLRASAKDPLNRQFPAPAASNWLPRSAPLSRDAYAKQFSRPHRADGAGAGDE